MKITPAVAFILLGFFFISGQRSSDHCVMASSLRWVARSMASRSNRDRMVIATKVGMEMAPDRKGLSPAYIRRAVEDSLKRLQTDHIDLYQSHTDDAATPLADTLGAYDKLIKAGKVRAIGASNYSAERFEEALAVSKQHDLPRYESMQPNYNLYDRASFEGPLRDLCVSEDIGVITFFSGCERRLSPLAMWRRKSPSVKTPTSFPRSLITLRLPDLA
jgi:aryl-alcohol dehydrogenase-like predicted oxidoreductase